MKLFRVLPALSLAIPLAAAALPALAQDYDRPPRGYEDPSSGDPDYPMTPRGRVDSPDAGSVAIRMSKAENRIRELTGQIEELQNANRRLVEQLQKFQADVDSRLSVAPPRKRAEAETRAPAEPDAVAQAEPSTPKPRRRHDDAFDPDTAGAAPGKPKPLGSAASAQPDDNGGAPMDLAGGKLARGASDDTLAPTLRLPSSTPRQVGGTVTTNGTIIANADPAAGAAPTTPRGEFDAALGLYRDKQYDGAEKGFTTFIQKNPKSKLAADATYYLGESFAQRGRSREAAEQYLKISTDYASSSRAPDAMLHLGMSLKQLGAKEQACATFSEVGKKYPNAPAYVKNGAERELKRAQC